MQGGPDRDRSVDRALRHSLRGSTTPQGECIDGETLAAWTEGRLRPDEAALVETHLADCTLCQQVLATFARTAPPATSIEPLWRRWRLQWLVPIATAATVAAIWVAQPRQDLAQVQARLAEKYAAASEPAPTPQPAPLPPPPQPQVQFQSPSVSSSPRLRQEAAAPAARPNATSELEKRVEIDRLQSNAPEGRIAAVQDKLEGRADANAREQAPAALNEAITVAKPDTPQASPATPSRAAAAPAVAPQQSIADARSRASAPQPARDAVQRALTEVSLTRPRNPFQILSPMPEIRWRVVSAAPVRVERSIDGGGRWETLSMPTDVVLTAGASPAPSICWIVGQAGTVVLTTDGTRFTRLTFPERVDLVSISATDDRHATVMSADGRSFRTDDGGRTWSSVRP